jgi:hypothetical protein
VRSAQARTGWRERRRRGQRKPPPKAGATKADARDRAKKPDRAKRAEQPGPARRAPDRQAGKQELGSAPGSRRGGAPRQHGPKGTARHRGHPRPERPARGTRGGRGGRGRRIGPARPTAWNLKADGTPPGEGANNTASQGGRPREARQPGRRRPEGAPVPAARSEDAGGARPAPRRPRKRNKTDRADGRTVPSISPPAPPQAPRRQTERWRPNPRGP